MQTTGSDVETLKLMVERKRFELSTLEAALKALNGEAERELPTPDPGTETLSIPPGIFKRMKLKDAVLRYFDMNGGKPAHIEKEVLPALMAGDAELGKPYDRNGNDRRPRHLKVTIRMNSKADGAFLYDDVHSIVQPRARHKSAKIA